jgi:hypothetical protein
LLIWTAAWMHGCANHYRLPKVAKAAASTIDINTLWE